MRYDKIIIRLILLTFAATLFVALALSDHTFSVFSINIQ